MAAAADVTFERLRHPEPHNWLMNHGDYNAHRFSALDKINKGNVRNLRFAFSVALGQRGGNENLLATPLVDDGFMYMTDAWGVLYKIDVRSGTAGPIVWKMDPGQAKMDRNRGAALWRNLVISVTSQDGRVVATDLDTRFLDALHESNLDVLRHDVRTDDLPEETFDLIHARLLLEHLPPCRPRGFLLGLGKCLGLQDAGTRR